MITYIRGTLASANAIHAIVEANGIGYQLLIPASLYSQLPQVGSGLLLHTAFVVREQSQTLYGFLDSADRDLFELLLTVSGIGPKIALSLIGHMASAHLCAAINKGDVASICRIPGIGKKSAERLIIEVKDKLHAFNASSDRPHDVAADALSALLNLGYQRSAAQQAIQTALDSDATLDLSGLITASLQHI